MIDERTALLLESEVTEIVYCFVEPSSAVTSMQNSKERPSMMGMDLVVPWPLNKEEKGKESPEKFSYIPDHILLMDFPGGRVMHLN